MITRGVACGLFGLLFGTSLAFAQDTAPPLDPPALVPPAAEPAAARPALTDSSREAKASQDHRPLLVIPGVTAPVPRKPKGLSGRPKAASGEDLPSPALTPPRDPRATAPSRRTAIPAERTVPPRVVIPLTLEPIPEDSPPGSDPDRGPSPESGKPRDARPRESPRPPGGTRPGPRSPSRGAGSGSRMGRLLGPVGSKEDSSGSESSISVEPRSDPAIDAAVKRRVEKQIQQTLGDRVRSVEVHVSGKTIVMHAQAARFWQRRSVRRSLETLTLPSGYRARVEQVD
jgi:hypothetical protein